MPRKWIRVEVKIPRGAKLLDLRVIHAGGKPAEACALIETPRRKRRKAT
jgi:hypothetical protein